MKSRIKELHKVVFFLHPEIYLHNEEKHKKGNCFACRIHQLCFKKQKLYNLQTKGYIFNHLEIMKPIMLSQRARKDANENDFYKKINITFPTLNDWKNFNISVLKCLVKKNIYLKYLDTLNYTLDNYFYFIREISGVPAIVWFKFHYVTQKYLNETIKYEEDFNEIETIEEVEEQTIILNRKRVRLGISSEIRKRIYQRDKYTCFYCGWQNGQRGMLDKPLTIDHIIPRNHGGSSKDENLITCCWDCNIKKNDKFLKEVVEEWKFTPQTDVKVKHYLKLDNNNIEENKLNKSSDIDVLL